MYDWMHVYPSPKALMSDIPALAGKVVHAGFYIEADGRFALISRESAAGELFRGRFVDGERARLYRFDRPISETCFGQTIPTAMDDRP